MNKIIATMEINELLDNKSTLLYILLKMLNESQSKIIDESIVYLLSPDDILKLLKVYGGKSLSLPKYDDFKSYLDLSLFFYLSKVLKLSRDSVCEKLSLNNREYNKLDSAVTSWYDKLDETDKINILSCSNLIKV